jgi:DNA adenine methylase
MSESHIKETISGITLTNEIRTLEKNITELKINDESVQEKSIEDETVNNWDIDLKLIGPIVKWAGGKTQIIKEVTDKFPKEIENYYEGFIGGGSVFLELLKLIETDNIKLSGEIYLNDINSDLVNMYSLIKNDVKLFIKNINVLITNYNQAKMIEQETRHKHIINLEEDISEYIVKGKSYVYYYYRELYNTTTNMNLRVSLFLFLNKTCFRGLFREGPNGFNVPFGNYETPGFYNKNSLVELNKLFNKYDVQFLNLDFVEFSKNIKENDFVYFDPPYYPLKKTSFTGYKKDSFDDKHTILVKLCNKLNDDNVKFVHSNSFCKFNVDNYKSYNIEKINCRRRINSKNPKDTDFEVIINN